MDNFEKQLYHLAASQPDAQAKALANFLFREVIEAAHAKYDISQDDMKTMCKDAVDRAALFLSIQNTPLQDPFAIYSVPALEWDGPTMDSDFAVNFIDTLKSFAGS